MAIERVLGGGRTVDVGYQYVSGSNLLMSVNQNVATCVAAGTNNGCRPNATYRNNNQYSSIGQSNYHGLHVSFVQRPTAWSSVRLTYTLSKSMNDVGEAFFSSPIDPTNVMRDWGRSDDDQRHRLVINGSVNTPMTPAATAWQRISHGFQLSGMLQVYSALPFNITSGLTSLQGTAEPSAREWRDDFREFRRAERGIHPAQCRNRQRFPRAERSSQPRAPDLRTASSSKDWWRRSISRTARTTSRAMQTLGAGHTRPIPCRRSIRLTAVGDPRTLQFGVRVTF